MHVNRRLRALKIYSSLVDLVFCLVLAALVIVPTSISFSRLQEVSGGDITILVLSILMGFVLSFLYLFIPSMFMKGYTIGMRIFHLQFVDKDGKPISLTKMLIRSFVVSLVSYLTLGIAIIINLVLIIKREDVNDFYDIYVNDNLKLVEAEVE
ncbi:MAG: RDD family protein [Coprobacillus sp.]|nr:RDD family protein [Coprobacillus sp.]